MRSVPFRIALAISLLAFALQTSFSQNKSTSNSGAAIRAVIEAQRDAWNRGDIEGYMDGYQRSPTTVFVSGDNVTHGWQTVLEHYKKGYDTREKMGVLTFTDLEITTLSKNSAVVVGRWHLQRAKDEPHGRFTLIFRRTRQGWKIIHDHTSSAS
jgi:uncharacterized protein (TIGR02246 family)